MIVGIDVGGTDLVAVLMDGDQVRTAVTQPAAPSLTGGVADALRALRKADAATSRAQAVTVSTATFETAVTTAKGLARTGCIRLCAPEAESVPPLAGWPAHLRDVVGEHQFVCRGGHEFDGAQLYPLDERELQNVTARLAAAGVGSVAITSAFSPINNEAELAAAGFLLGQLPDVRVTLSHEIASIGLLERENATIINAALRAFADEVASALAREVEETIPAAQVYIAQNDGTVMELSFAHYYPVFTFWAGSTSAMRGAALLSGCDDCIVVDVGASTTEIGVVSGGYPPAATQETSLAGIRTNLRRPEVLTIPVGAASVVTPGKAPTIGPTSAAPMVLGGSELTVVDIAVAAGMEQVGDPSHVRRLNRDLIRRSLAAVAAQIEHAVLTVAPANSLPLVLVGQGARVVPDLASALRPAHGTAVRAVGAASTRIGGEVDRIISGDPAARASALERAKSRASQKAVMAGAADHTIQITEVDEIPLAYLPGDFVRLRIKAVGDLA